MENHGRKSSIRKMIWKRMEGEGVTRFPRPVEGRIPNFDGAKIAADRLAGLQRFKEASRIKVNPDSPQHPVRKMVIEEGKILYMPTPRLREGLLKIDSSDVPHGEEGKAATIKHSAKYGVKIGPDEMAEIELVVAGSVGVTKKGGRIGKGGGYSDLEYAILGELDLGNPPTATTVHPLQIVDEIPVESHDVPMDWIVTPDEVIETGTRYERPEGIDWSLINREDLERIPWLRRLKEMKKSHYWYEG